MRTFFFRLCWCFSPTHFFTENHHLQMQQTPTKLLLLIATLFAACTAPEPTNEPLEILYVGTYTVRGSEGIYAFQFDRANQTFEPIDTMATLDSPSFLTISPDKCFLYSVNRAGVDTSTNFGSVSAFSIDSKSGQLNPLNTTSSFGKSPCHISLRADGEEAYISHYGGGSLSVLEIDADGSIGSLIDTLSHTGSGVNAQRQEAPHVHSIQQIPGTEQVIVADLGIDQLKIYHLENDTLTPAILPAVKTELGAGPRHFTFSPDGRLLYVAEELSSTVSVHQLNLEDGSAEQLQRLSTLPDDFAAYNTVADIHRSPDGQFLYVSNRGHNSLAIYEVDSTSGELTLLGHQKTGGDTPRNFHVDVKGEFVLVAHQDSDNITVFERDGETGLLTKLDVELQVPSPVCLKMVELRN